MLQPKTIALALGATLLASAPAFAADDVAELKKQMQALMKQNAELANKLQDMEKQIKTIDANVGAVPKTFKVVTAGDEEGTIKLPGSETSIGIYGFIHVDAYKDFKGNPEQNGGDWAADIGKQPLNNGADDQRKGKSNLTARVSRIGFKTYTPTEMGILRTKLEGDFVPGRLRVRHAYGEIDGDWGKLLGGQTWSTFMNLDAMPETVDFNGHGSAAFVRQAMVRYTAKLGNYGELDFSIENPENLADGALGPQNSPNINTRPDLIAKWTKTFSRGFISAQALTGQLKARSATDSGTVSTWGFGLGGAWKITDKDNLMLQLTTGKGIGRYIPAAYYQQAYLDGNLKAYSSNSWVAGWSHAWSDTVRSNLAYGQTTIRDEFDKTGGTEESRRLSEGFANVFWAFAKNTELGLEYNWGTRTTYGDDSAGGIKYKGKRSRVQASLQYNF